MTIAKENELDEKVTSIDISNKNEYILYLESEKKTVYLGNQENLTTKMLYTKKIIEKEISETDLDHIKSGPNELVIGNFWIFKGKITILKSSLFPIDPFIIMYTAILMEIIFWIKAKISRFREKQK